MIQLSNSREMEEESVFKRFIAILECWWSWERVRAACCWASHKHQHIPARCCIRPDPNLSIRGNVLPYNVISNCVALEARYSGFTSY